MLITLGIAELPPQSPGPYLIGISHFPNQPGCGCLAILNLLCRALTSRSRLARKYRKRGETRNAKNSHLHQKICLSLKNFILLFIPPLLVSLIQVRIHYLYWSCRLTRCTIHQGQVAFCAFSSPTANALSVRPSLLSASPESLSSN